MWIRKTKKIFLENVRCGWRKLKGNEEKINIKACIDKEHHEHVDLISNAHSAVRDNVVLAQLF